MIPENIIVNYQLLIVYLKEKGYVPMIW